MPVDSQQMTRSALRQRRGSRFGEVLRTILACPFLCSAATPGATLSPGATYAGRLAAHAAQLAYLESRDSPGGGMGKRRMDPAWHHDYERTTKMP